MGGRSGLLARGLFLLLFLSTASAAHNPSLTYEIWPDGTSEVRALLVADSRGLGTLSIPAEKAQFVSVNDDESALRFVALDDELLIGPSREDGEYPLELRYQTAALTSKEGDTWAWSLGFDHGFWERVGEVAVVAEVPAQAVLISYTEGGVVYSNGGLHIGWRVSNPGSTSGLKVEYRLEPGAFFPDSPDESWKTLLLVVFGSIIGGVLLWVVYDRVVRKVSSGKKDILDALDKKERLVMEHLIGSGKELTQTQVAKQIGLSKASVSRAIKRLREKELVTTRDLGTATLVSISPHFSKK